MDGKGKRKAEEVDGGNGRDGRGKRRGQGEESDVLPW